MSKITKIILLIAGLSLLGYFLFLPIEIRREKPQRITPQEEIPLTIPEEEFPTSTEQ